MARSKQSVEVTNTRASRLPRRRGTFASSPPAPEPIHAEPRERVGERFKTGPSVEVTSEKTQRTTRAKGGAA